MMKSSLLRKWVSILSECVYVKLHQIDFCTIAVFIFETIFVGVLNFGKFQGGLADFRGGLAPPPSPRLATWLVKARKQNAHFTVTLSSKFKAFRFLVLFIL